MPGEPAFIIRATARRQQLKPSEARRLGSGCSEGETNENGPGPYDPDPSSSSGYACVLVAAQPFKKSRTAVTKAACCSYITMCPACLMVSDFAPLIRLVNSLA